MPPAPGPRERGSEATKRALPFKVRSQLNRSQVPARRGIHHGGHLSESRRRWAQIRQVELRVVQNVEELALKRYPDALLDPDVLIHRRIEAPEPRARDVEPLPERAGCGPLREVFVVGRPVGIDQHWVRAKERESACRVIARVFQQQVAEL